MQKFRTGLFVLALFLAFGVRAQGPYQLNWGKELTLTGIGLTAGLTGAYLRSTVPIYTVDELAALDAASLNAFDRKAVDNTSLKAHQLSNVFWFSAFATPMLVFAGKKPRSNFGTVAAIWGETMLLSSSLTLLTKYAVRRPRPYVYNSSTTLEKKQSTRARSSFFSGHTSLSAASTFFAAQVYSDYYPESKWKPLVWGVAAAIPAVTGYLRVKGGRHYPTDVIVGYGVGAVIGWGVPLLHRKALKNDKLSLQCGFNFVGIRWLVS